ncbi:MAG TPA: hypothetical protein VNH83_00650 [Bryobacteraceae bacterium]|nr:hypothetical protein [Bryobacteraceae bacterium]
MAIRIQPFTEEFTGAVVEFNRRMRPAGVPFGVPETGVPEWLPKLDGRKIHQEIFLAVEDGCVRGAYTFKQQPFSFGGRILWVGACQMPISEGIIDKRYSLVGPQIISDALRRQPLSYGLGIGSRDAAVTRLLSAMGWRLTVIPFFFKVRHGFRFLRNIQHLRNTPFRRWLCDIAAYSGLGWAGAKVIGAARSRSSGPALSVERAGEFSSWADDLWWRCRDRYSMIALRDASVLNILYPPTDARFIRLKILDGRRVVGWSVVMDSLKSGDKYFGNMRVGAIADCLALPEDASQVVRASVRALEECGVDLLVSNQSHPAWGRGLKKAGFLAGPSNFYFITSKELTRLLDESDPAGARIHLNRGDGDGPIHL